ncbi:MAG TPA: AraC family transcriptional regulator [Puia sp.]|jgi:AraC family transcriptional regulator|nr:AraC family transcriptional regulator [Puia sp.]
MNLFKVLDKENCVALNLSIDKSCAVLCTLAEAQISNAFKYSTLRLVVDGHAEYILEKKSYRISKNEFLICNGDQDGIGIIDSKKEVSQICIHLKPSLISDAFRLLTSGDHFDLDKRMDGYPDCQLFENAYNLNSSLAVSKSLRPLVALIKEGRGNEIYLDEEWLLNLAEAIVLNEKTIRVSLSGLRSVRHTTRNEIMKRLLIGKEYMDANFTKNPKIAGIASLAFMSEFFFYRNFKLAFRTTPYQYILDKKIGLAKELIQDEKMGFAEIAESCGFPDIFTFSKAFKRKCGFAPARYRPRGYTNRV